MFRLVEMLRFSRVVPEKMPVFCPIVLYTKLIFVSYYFLGDSAKNTVRNRFSFDTIYLPVACRGQTKNLPSGYPTPSQPRPPPTAVR